MNIYKTKFFAVCAANGVRIEYDLEITTGSVLKVESIISTVAQIASGFHEDIADLLHERLGGSQRLKAFHHGVNIETIRPHLAHWQKPGPATDSMTESQALRVAA